MLHLLTFEQMTSKPLTEGKLKQMLESYDVGDITFPELFEALSGQPSELPGAWIKCVDRMPADESKLVNWRCIDMSDGDYTLPSQMKKKYKKPELEWWDEDAPQPVNDPDFTYEEKEFERCSQCDGHDACEDFGCRIELSQPQPVQSIAISFLEWTWKTGYIKYKFDDGSFGWRNNYKGIPITSEELYQLFITSLTVS